MNNTDRKAFIAIANPEESDELRERYRTAIEEANREAGIAADDCEIGIDVAGHAASWEVLGLCLFTAYEVYKKLKDGAELVDDAKKAIEFTRKMPAYLGNIKNEVGRILSQDGPAAAPKVVSITKEFAAILAVADAIDSFDPGYVKVHAVKSLPEVDTLDARERAHSYRYAYVVEVRIDGCIVFAFVDNDGSIDAKIHVTGEYGTCNHGRARRITVS